MKRSLLIGLLILSMGILPSCGGSSSGSSGSGGSGGGGSSTPSITSISPSTVTGGGPAFTLTVNGSNFTTGTTVELTLTSNGTIEKGITTTFVSATKLTVAVPASAIAVPGNMNVELLQNGVPVSSESANAALTIGGSIPHITSISPTTLTEGGPAFTLTVNGTGFIQNDSIVWNGDTGPFPGGIATFVSSTQLTIAVPAQAIAYPGSAEIQVVFYVVDGANITSNEVPLVVNPALGVAQSASVGVNGATPNGPSSNPEISDDGRFISFASQATNLVTPTTLFPQVYVYDDCVIACSTPTTLLVSAEPAGSPANPVEPNGQSVDPSLGAIMLGSVVDGFQGIDHFAFLSAATNLVLPSTTQQQAYLRNTCYVQGAISGCNPINYLVSGTQSGAEPNGPATDVILPKGGCNVAFISSGTDLIAGVTTPNELYLSDCNSTESESPIFATSTVLSESNSGMPANQGATEPAVDEEITSVAFASTSTNLTSTSTGGFQQIYLHVTCFGLPTGCQVQTIMASVDSSGNALQGNSANPGLSENSRYVTYTTAVPQPGGAMLGTIYRYDLCNLYVNTANPFPGCANPPAIATISIGAGGAAANASSSSGRNALSSDGRYVAFDSQATNIIAGGNPAGQVFVRDTCSTSEYGTTGVIPGCTPTTNMVSVSDGTAIGGSQEAISGDGHRVVFVTTINGVQQVVLAYTGF
jgi:hypothetical protein